MTLETKNQSGPISGGNSRAELIDKIVAIYEQLERGRSVPVERFELIGSDGKSYSGGGMPYGVTFKKRGKSYWVLQSAREGTTHGKRYDTREELEATREKGIKARGEQFREDLLPMTDEQLQSQAEYWFKQ